MHKMFSM